MSNHEIQRAQGAIFTNIFMWFVELIPTSWITTIMSSYISASNKVHSIIDQTKFSWQALSHSFKNQSVKFYRVNDTFVPFYTFFNDSPYMTPGVLSWVYDCKERTFLEVDSEVSTNRRLPFIGMSLMNTETGSCIADMSDWITDIHIHSTDANVPAQVLVGAYAFENNLILPRELNTLILECTTLTLDKTIYNLQTGKELAEQVYETETSETEI